MFSYMYGMYTKFYSRVEPIPSGETLLHAYVREAKSPEYLKEMLNKHSEPELLKMAKTVNDAGQIPYDILLNKNYSEKTNQPFLELLLPITIKHAEPIQPIFYQINIQDILEKYQPTPGGELEHNLKIATQIVNQCGSNDFKSYTHPVSNDPSGALYSKIDRLFKEVDEQFIKRITELMDTVQLPTLWPPVPPKKRSTLIVDFQNDIRFQLVENAASFFIENNIGNCNHLSYIGLAKAKKIRNLLSDIEIIVISKGGHTVIVIGRSSDSGDYRKWGHAAVVADPWLRRVFPVSSGEFATHRDIVVIQGDNYVHNNIITSFNPSYHTFQRAIHPVVYRDKVEIQFLFSIQGVRSLIKPFFSNEMKKEEEITQSICEYIGCASSDFRI